MSDQTVREVQARLFLDGDLKRFANYDETKDGKIDASEAAKIPDKDLVVIFNEAHKEMNGDSANMHCALFAELPIERKIAMYKNNIDVHYQRVAIGTKPEDAANVINAFLKENNPTAADKFFVDSRVESKNWQKVFDEISKTNPDYSNTRTRFDYRKYVAEGKRFTFDTNKDGMIEQGELKQASVRTDSETDEFHGLVSAMYKGMVLNSDDISLHHIYSGLSPELMIHATAALGNMSSDKKTGGGAANKAFSHFISTRVYIDIEEFLKSISVLGQSSKVDMIIALALVLDLVEDDAYKELAIAAGYEFESDVGEDKTAKSQFKIENTLAVTDKTFENEVVKSKTPVLVFVGTSWCPACKESVKAVQDAAEEYGTTLKIVTVDGDSETEITNRLGVDSIPTFVLFIKGKKILSKSQAATDKETLINFIKEFLPPPQKA